MSILDNPPDKVTVIPKVKTRNQYNAWDLTDGPPIEVGCDVQTVTAEEATAFGGTVANLMRRCIGRGPWPGGPHSTVLWRGSEWDAEGDDREYTSSAATAHFDVIIRKRTSEVK